MKKFRSKRKFRSTPREKGPKQVKVPTLFAQSPVTKLTHGFANPTDWERDIAIFARIFGDRMAQDLYNSVPFWNWLNQQTAPTLALTQKWNTPLIRIVYGGFDPLSVAGTLASGGRYNLGGAQQSSFAPLSGLRMQAALYTADSVDCANAEAGSPLGVAEVYRLSAANELTLWDIDQVVNHFSWPNLKALIEAQPFNKAWSLQKSPTISQLLGTYLRTVGADGILSRSTKYAGGHVATVFLTDDIHSKKLFTVDRL